MGLTKQLLLGEITNSLFKNNREDSYLAIEKNKSKLSWPICENSYAPRGAEYPNLLMNSQKADMFPEAIQNKEIQNGEYELPEKQPDKSENSEASSFLFIGPIGKKRRMAKEHRKIPVEVAEEEEEDESSKQNDGRGGQEEPLDLCCNSNKSQRPRPKKCLEKSEKKGSSFDIYSGSSNSGDTSQFSQFSPTSPSASISSSSNSKDFSTGSKKKLQCPDCGKEFSQLRNYRYHRSRHEGTTQFACTCPICGKSFNDKGYLSSHLKIHRNAKEYQCEWCEKSFNQRVAYNMHIRIHSGYKPHKCDYCPKAFSRKMLLSQHLRVHTGERPFKCEVCQKPFADRSNMLLHQRLHTGQRPYQCKICSKSFSKNHHLKTHLNHHLNIKPYQCSKCLSFFSQSSNMKTHSKKCTGIANTLRNPSQTSTNLSPTTSTSGRPPTFSLPSPSPGPQSLESQMQQSFLKNLSPSGGGIQSTMTYPSSLSSLPMSSMSALTLSPMVHPPIPSLGFMPRRTVSEPSSYMSPHHFHHPLTPPLTSPTLQHSIPRGPRTSYDLLNNPPVQNHFQIPTLLNTTTVGVPGSTTLGVNVTSAENFYPFLTTNSYLMSPGAFKQFRPPCT